jgi:hypothetical protein
MNCQVFRGMEKNSLFCLVVDGGHYQGAAEGSQEAREHTFVKEEE